MPNADAAATISGDLHIERVRLETRMPAALAQAELDAVAQLAEPFMAGLDDADIAARLLEDFRALLGQVPRVPGRPPPALPQSVAELKALAPEAWQMVAQALTEADAREDRPAHPRPLRPPVGRGPGISAGARPACRARCQRGRQIHRAGRDRGRVVRLSAPHRLCVPHETKDLRLALALRARDGREGRFVRLKRRKDDLLDGDDRPLPEAALAAFLGGATRERFARVFGLDAAELRKGGAAILEGEGEVGESILQAHTGMRGFRALVKRLDDEAAQLHGDRRGQRALRDAATDAFKAARQALDARSVEPAAYKQQRDAQDQLQAWRGARPMRRKPRRLHGDSSRLRPLRRTAPALRARARALAERAAMGEVPVAESRAEARRQAALLARDQAAHDLRREQASAEGLESPLPR